MCSYVVRMRNLRFKNSYYAKKLEQSFLLNFFESFAEKRIKLLTFSLSCRAGADAMARAASTKNGVGCLSTFIRNGHVILKFWQDLLFALNSIETLLSVRRTMKRMLTGRANDYVISFRQGEKNYRVLVVVCSAKFGQCLVFFV